jgi:L-ascorbate metabolism protein UlaG (beta-lactamase superfamily)
MLSWNSYNIIYIMNIQYYGHSCFKITTKPAGRATDDVVVFIDPFDKSVGLRPPQGQANAVFITHNHPDHNNFSALKGDPMIIDTPGEYSIKGINVTGIDIFHGEFQAGKKEHNTIFIMEVEDMKICHVGDLGEDIAPETLEMIEGVDVLFIPVGGKYTIGGKKAAEICRKTEPKIIIPMHYKMNGSTVDIDTEKKFCTEMGNCPSEKVNRLNLKKKDLEEKMMEVVLMGIE